MKTLLVSTKTAKYPILIGRDLSGEVFAEHIRGRKAICLVDANVAELHAEKLDQLLPGIPRLTVPAGESSKSLTLYRQLSEQLLALGLGRDGVLVSVGGGVTGDLCGFIAATYMRGIPFIQVPTTLLAQVDSAVGGKVAVNLPGAKNALGCFHQPQAVLTDIDLLDTLEPRQVRAGLAEAVKMAVCLDSSLVDWIEQQGAGLLDPAAPAMAELIHRSCQLKSDIVARDEKESGCRRVLNFGHTLAHAIEAYTPGTGLLHGEAVSIGMIFALSLGELALDVNPRVRARLDRILRSLNLPVSIPADLDPARLLEIIGTDKKNLQGRPQFVLLEGWGAARLDITADDETILELIRAGQVNS
ncbi:MAG: 3-dehydroquinate synthase [bacterium]|nr:3-dehydroquinate synthase [bacterium]